MSLVSEFYEAARLARETGRARAEASRPFGARSSGGAPKGEDWNRPGGKKGGGKGKGGKCDQRKGKGEKNDGKKAKGG